MPLPQLGWGMMKRLLSGAKNVFAAIACTGTIVLVSTQASIGQDLKGAGSTFVAPVMAEWIRDYATLTHMRIDYQPVGSGTGIKAVEAADVDFGATDKPLDSRELARFGLCQFPVVVGGIVPVLNLPGLGEIRFSGRILANIFMGRITRWDDPDIAGANPSLALPELAITVVYRSDRSGTTYNFSDFLSRSNDEWKKRYGATLALNVPTGAARNGNAGVAAAVQQTQGAIGYVEYAYALKNYLTYGAVANAFGVYVPPSSDSFQAAASAVNWQQYPDFGALMTNPPAPQAYPIAATTFVLLPKTPRDPSRTATAIAFFKWALEHGQNDALELRYAPLPPDLVAMIENYWSSHVRPVPVAVRALRKTVDRSR